MEYAQTPGRTYVCRCKSRLSLHRPEAHKYSVLRVFQRPGDALAAGLGSNAVTVTEDGRRAPVVVVPFDVVRELDGILEQMEMDDAAFAHLQIGHQLLESRSQ